MYVNPHFALDDVDALHELIEERPMGTLVAPGPEVRAAHIPFVLDRGPAPYGLFRAHTPSRDPISRRVMAGGDVLVIFFGPWTYVSPDWYEEPGFGTYNFIAIHAHCRPAPMADEAEVRAHLRELTELHQRRLGADTDWGAAQEERLEQLRPHIVPFRLHIIALEGKAKLSQNRSRTDRRRVVAGLRAHRPDDGALAIADLMESFRYSSDLPRPLLEPPPDAAADRRGDREGV